MKDLKTYLTGDTHLPELYKPTIFRVTDLQDKQALEKLFKNGQISFVQNEMYGQLQELIKSKNPSVKIKANEYPALIDAFLDGKDMDEYGVWVYYPWSKRLVHLLDEEDFVEVRTNRNQYKITRDEQAELRKKKIGVIGLSVGQSIALTMAIERIFGELRLADFDTAELSNLNRIRTGVQNLGLNKTVIVAREIAEIDPFLKVNIFSDGLTEANMDQFFTGNGKLDLLVEVCDGLDIKILSRYKARELQIPVIMDTNDKGMLDVERFDLEPDRDILHGLANGLDPQNIKDLSNEDKIPYILKMIGAETISTRLKASMLEVEQSINTWPQLASSVTLGGALTTDVSRRLLLNQFHASGRYYVDMEDLVKDETEHQNESHPVTANPHAPLTKEAMVSIASGFLAEGFSANYQPTADELDKLIEAAIAAPSAGNNQPWKWYFSNGILFLFHDKIRSWSWGDYYEMGAHLSLGTAIENIHLEAGVLGLQDQVKLFPLSNTPELIAVINFHKANEINNADLQLANGIFTRATSRKNGERTRLNADFFNQLQSIISNHGVEMFHVEDDSDMHELSDIIAETDKVRLLNKLGHEEFYHEIRWNKEDALKTKDGVELASVDISQGEIAGFKVAGDWKAVELLSKWNKGNAFKKMSVKSVKSASAIILFTVPEFSHSQLLIAGRAVQRAWITANQNGVAVHPMLSPAFFFNRLIHGGGAELSTQTAQNLTVLRQRFFDVFKMGASPEQRYEVFLMKVSVADNVDIARSLRKDKSELFFSDQY
ncbi:Rv1355c family protein [Mucilaginibacter sp. CSA2-8R]|uniref:Rv1355c family protein n=1 Tax=Mucilaginibacter sp. CSA2-8R TaxID=3141542 RepID=UPI00315D2777